MKKEKILELFTTLCKGYKDEDPNSPKLLAIQDWMKERGMTYNYIPDVGLFSNIDIHNPPKIIIMAHIDLIPLFSKGFENNRMPVITDTHVIGGLDNTICNAVALLVFEELIKRSVTNVGLFLSEGEEVGCDGARNFLRYTRKFLQNTFFVNLDVTNEGYGLSGSFEYDEPNPAICRQLVNQFKDTMFYTQERVCDDTDMVNAAELNGFSYCLPTKDNIHSYKNKAKLKSLEPYAEGLLWLAQHLDTQCIQMPIEFLDAKEINFAQKKKFRDKTTLDLFDELIEEQARWRERQKRLEELKNESSYSKSKTKKKPPYIIASVDPEDYSYIDKHGNCVYVGDLWKPVYDPELNMVFYPTGKVDEVDPESHLRDKNGFFVFSWDDGGFSEDDEDEYNDDEDEDYGYLADKSDRLVDETWRY